MAVTIYDVAKKAGVGIGTVSRAINDSPQIRSDTKKRVLQAAAELGYSPHTLARGLARRRTGIIAVIMPFYTGHFYQELLRGIQKALSKYNYDLMLYYIDKPEKRGAYFDRTLRERRCDGVLAISMDISDEYIEKFRNMNLPLVLVDRVNHNVDCVQVENTEGAYRAAQYLISLGHRKIAMISGNSESIPTQERRIGFEKALAEANIPSQSCYFVASNMLQDGEELAMNDGFNPHAGQLAMESMLALGDQRPTAVFAAADILAIGAMKAASKHGLHVPEDIAIVGFDDIELSAYLAISTMKQPMYEMGKTAVERIMNKIEKKDRSIQQICLKTRLVKRGSSEKLDASV